MSNGGRMEGSALVTDVHAHIGNTVALALTHTWEEYAATMDRAGVQRAFLSPMAGGRQAHGIEDTVAENDAIARALRADPQRFPIGLGTVEIRHEELAVRELERCFDQLGLHGVAFHAMFSGFTVEAGGVLDPLMTIVEARRGLCLMHVMPEWGAFSMESPRAVGTLAERFPGVTFVMGHPAITHDQRAVAIEAAIGRDNILLDLAFQTEPETVETLVRALGAERVLFGSDAPFRDPSETLSSIERADIGADARRRIVCENAAELIARHAER